MDVDLIIESAPKILGGMWLTIQMVTLSLSLGFFCAIGVALVRVSSVTWAVALVRGYVFVMRGTPLLVQLFLIYYGLGQFTWIKDTFLWTFLREPYFCAILAMVINTTAYGSEIIRGGLESVSWGEKEAARAFGMSGFLLFRRIVFPIAFRQALPAYGNEAILMVKATSLASTITMMEMTGIAGEIMSETYKPMEPFIVAGSLYLLINFVLTRVVQGAEYRLMGHLRASQ